MYAPNVNGLCGNDDAGQMSAWYIFSSLGFYPVTPGSDVYALGSPLVKEAVIRLDNGKELRIVAENQSPENVYVSKVTWNGRELSNHEVHHSDLMAGGDLVFTMRSTPE